MSTHEKRNPLQEVLNRQLRNSKSWLSWPGTLRFADRDDDAFFFPEVCHTEKDGKRTSHTWPKGVRRYSYRRNPILPDGNMNRFDNVQLAFNAIPFEQEEDWVSGLPRRVPKFTMYKCTDYEYALNTIAPEYGGGTEVWRLLVPGMPRKHFYPRQAKHPLEGAVDGARLVTVHEGGTRITELALPWGEIPHVRRLMEAGQPVKLSFRVNHSSGGPLLELARGPSVSRINSPAYHPDWKESWANEVEFAWEK